MCWAVPARVLEVRDLVAKVDFGGAVREVIIATEEVRPGDIVLVHAGAVIGKVRREELLDSLKMYKEMSVELAVASGIPREEAERQAEEYISYWLNWLGEKGDG